MGKPKLAIDIDDVLFPFSREFLKYANIKLNSNKTLADMVVYRLDTVYGVDYQVIIDIIKQFMAEPWLKDLLPMPNTRTALELLAKHFELHVVTARLLEYKPQTDEWLALHLPGLFKEVHYCSFYALDPNKANKITKGIKCSEIDAICLIDDNVDNVMDVIAHGIEGVLFGEYAWHRELPENCKPVRLKDWYTIISRTALYPGDVNDRS